jgi:enoyl-CoA hydratase
MTKSFPAEDLAERAASEARAISHIDSGLLAANKQQVNQAYELMGMRTHLAQSWMWHHLSSSARPNAGEYFKVAKADGMKAALTWMNGPFEAEGLL